MKKLMLFPFILCLLLTASCGKDGSSSSSGTAAGGPDNASAVADLDDDAPLAGNPGLSAAGAGSFSLDSFTGEQDAPADTLHDPGTLLGAEAKQSDDQVIDGVTYKVYVYEFDEASSIKLNFYSGTLEDEGYSIEKTDTDGDTALYTITGPDGVAVLRVYNPLFGSPAWTLYVPDGMAFTPNQDDGSSGAIAGSSFQNDSYLGGSSAVSGGSFQNGSYLGGSGAITGGSFQNENFLAGAEDPIVVDGLMICTACDGTGICHYCGGMGVVKYDMHNYETCAACDGAKICTVCDGTGNWGPAA